MTQAANIILSSANVDNAWQSGNAVQIVKGDVYIFVDDAHPHRLMQIQKAARSVEKMGVAHARLVGEQWCQHTQWAFAMGFTCVGKLTNVEFTGDESLVNDLNDKLAVYAWSRDLTNQTPAQLYPLSLAEQVSEYLKAQAPAYITANVISGEALIEAQWMGIYNVGKGSINPPCLVEIDYNPSGKESEPVTASLVGKGITFDSGGYSIKSSEGMFSMKSDMGGAAVVSGALALAIRQGLKKRVKLFLCCAENMISRDAYKLGDIITYKNGVTCEVANTDAEGRLVLADGLMAACATKSPIIIDAATLTGAAVLATGGDYTALFALDPEAAELAKQAADKVCEPIWQLPLESWHQDKCPSAFADTANSRTQKGGGAGGASNAAGFLARFVDNDGKGWLHFDLAAAYKGHEDGFWGVGATGISIATIAEMLHTQ